MPAYLPDFFMYPSSLINEEKIRPTDCLIYGVIYWYSRLKLQKCVLSNDAIAEMLKITTSASRQGIYRLIKAGYVKAIYADDDKTRRIELIPLVVMGGVTNVTGGVSQMRQGGVTNVTHNKNIKEEQLDNSNIVVEHPIVNEKNNYIEVEPQNELSALAVTDKGRVEEAAKSEPELLIEHFNSVYKKKYGAGQVAQITGTGDKKKKTINLFEYWRGFYSLEEMKQAINNSLYDSWWKEKLTPVMLLRTKNPQGEPVDYIGKFLNAKIPITVRPLTDIEFYQLCKKLNVPHDIVKGRYDFLMDKAGKGEFKNPDDEETVVSALTRWVEKDKSTGEVAECNEFEAMDIEDLHPRRKAEIQLFKKQSELQQVFDKFTQLKKKLDEAPEEEKETYKAQLRDIAPKGKQLQIEVGEAKALVKQMREAYGVS